MAATVKIEGVGGVAGAVGAAEDRPARVARRSTVEVVESVVRCDVAVVVTGCGATLLLRLAVDGTNTGAAALGRAVDDTTELGAVLLVAKPLLLVVAGTALVDMAMDDGTDTAAALLLAVPLRAVLVRLGAVDVAVTVLLAVMVYLPATDTPLLLVTGPAADFPAAAEKRLDDDASEVRRDCDAEAAARGGS